MTVSITTSTENGRRTTYRSKVDWGQPGPSHVVASLLSLPLAASLTAPPFPSLRDPDSDGGSSGSSVSVFPMPSLGCSCLPPLRKPWLSRLDGGRSPNATTANPTRSVPKERASNILYRFIVEAGMSCGPQGSPKRTEPGGEPADHWARVHLDIDENVRASFLGSTRRHQVPQPLWGRAGGTRTGHEPW